MKKADVVSKIAMALFREYRKSSSSTGKVAIHNVAAELDKEFPGVLDELEVALAVI